MAARSFSPPPCGEGSGVGVVPQGTVVEQLTDPPPRPSPSRNRVYAGFGHSIERSKSATADFDWGEGERIPAKAGIGLRFQHHQVVLDIGPDVAWMEVHTENYMGGGTPLRYLDAIRRDYPISLHGVGLSLGSAEGLDDAHLERIRRVAERIEPGLMSEHIAWSVVGGTYLADLLPLPMTEESLAVVCGHVDQVQTHLKRRILVENPSTYIAFGNSIIPE